MLIKYFQSLVNLIYPTVCICCNGVLLAHETTLCNYCELTLPVTPYINQNNNSISAIFKGRIHLNFATSFLLFHKSGQVQKLIHALKYKNRPDIGELLGDLFAQHLSNEVIPDALIPVPLHPDKQKERGYNQSLHIALGMAETMGIPVLDNIIVRNTKNPSQTTLNRADRWNNVQSIFTRTEEVINVNYVWIIDDTLTTGSTIEACARCIENEVQVGVATLAYAD